MKKNPVKGIEAKMMQRYLETRKLIAKKADRIVSLSHLLSLLKHCPDDTVPMSPSALASYAEMINSDLCGIVECLDDFIFPTDAEAALDDQ
jgi:hypothetical protein